MAGNFNNANLMQNDKIKTLSYKGDNFNANSNNFNNPNVKPENDKIWNLSNNDDANLQTTKTNLGFSK
jgi:hypothetical protein